MVPSHPLPCSARRGSESFFQAWLGDTDTHRFCSSCAHSETYWRVVSVFLIMRWVLLDKRPIHQTGTGLSSSSLTSSLSFILYTCFCLLLPHSSARFLILFCLSLLAVCYGGPEVQFTKTSTVHPSNQRPALSIACIYLLCWKLMFCVLLLLLCFLFLFVICLCDLHFRATVVFSPLLLSLSHVLILLVCALVTVCSFFLMFLAPSLSHWDSASAQISPPFRLSPPLLL